MASLLLAALLTQAQAVGAAPKPIERVSLHQGTVADAWASPGFRLGLAFSAGGLWGEQGAADATVVGATIRAGWRFNRRFSLLSAFTYHVLLGDLVGLRYAITLEPTWHPVAGLSLGIGVGYAGIVGQRDDNYGPLAGSEGRETQPGVYAPPDPITLSDCNGGGIVGVLRAGYLFRIGRVGSTGPIASFFAQGSRCVADDEWGYESSYDRELVDWWPHLGFSLAWTFLWR